jgi:hypothetical protein
MGLRGAATRLAKAQQLSRDFVVTAEVKQMKSVSFKQPPAYCRGRDRLHAVRDRRKSDLVAAKDAVGKERRIGVISAHLANSADSGAVVQGVQPCGLLAQTPLSN